MKLALPTTARVRTDVDAHAALCAAAGVGPVERMLLAANGPDVAAKLLHDMDAGAPAFSRQRGGRLTPEVVAQRVKQQAEHAERSRRFRQRLDVVAGIFIAAAVLVLMVLPLLVQRAATKHADDCLRDAWGHCRTTKA